MSNAPPERLGSRGKIGLFEAIAANILQMVGVGPFLTIPLILSAMGGPQAMVGWGLGALISACDGLVWAELGAAMPGSGGSYKYLREAYGPRSLGQLMSFIFLFQSIVVTPLLAASGGVGFADYAKSLYPAMTYWQGKAVAFAVCLVATALLYRNIRSIGRVSMVLVTIVMGTMVWIIVAGATHFNPALAFAFPPGAFHPSAAFFTGLGAATLIAMYDYQGYCTAALIGDEVKAPNRNLPRSILLAIGIVAIGYTAMSFSVIGVIPWKETLTSTSIVSDLIGRVYGSTAAKVSAVLVLLAAFGSVFAVLLGFSRVPYAAALEGNFFSIFARVHPKGFPSFSIVFMGVASACACLFSLESLIDGLIIVQILTQFAAQCVAVVLIRRYRKDIQRPFRMYLYPLPVVIALAGWVFIVVSAQARYIIFGMCVLVAAVIAFLIRARSRSEWPLSKVA
jgi:amino acid transporter